MSSGKGRADLIAEWIAKWFQRNGQGCCCVIGISGGKDSAVVAALAVRALGADKVIGVELPCGEQPDIGDADRLIELLGIRKMRLDIAPTVESIAARLEGGASDAARKSLQPRIRMVALYAIAQTFGGRVANTSNLSERYIGWFTRFGDAAGDFAPIANLTATEVCILGRELGLPEDLISKAPADGLGKEIDEELFGFTYSQLDTHIRLGNCGDAEADARIEAMHEASAWKRDGGEERAWRGKHTGE